MELDIFHELNDDEPIEEIEKRIAKLRLQAQQITASLDDQLTQRNYMDNKIKTLSNIIPRLNNIKEESKNLVSSVKCISQTSDKINGEIKNLDLARSRIEECQKKVSDLIDLELCAQGVQTAINNEDYEKGAGHIHRFLSIDQVILKRISTDSDKASGILKSVRTLQDAASQLRAIVKHHFDEATKNNDLAAIERFFKIFPLLGLHDEGITNFCYYLIRKLEDTAQKNLNSALSTPKADKRYPIVYADTLTLLFETLARIIDVHQPLIETYYGPGHLFSVVTILQGECDKQCRRIMMEFHKNRNISKKVSHISEVNTNNSSSKLERMDPKDLDLLLSEMTLMHFRSESYIKYISKKVKIDLDIGVPDLAVRKQKLNNLEILIKNSQLSQSKHELLGNYIRFEQYFMEESIAKAVTMDTLDTSSEQKTSSVVDDTFFIIQKCIRRAISSGSLDGCCAIINTACRVMESDYCKIFENRFKLGYPSGYLDLTQAYNVLHSSIQQGRLQPNDAEQAKTTFIVTLNNTDISCEYVEQLCDSILQDVQHALPDMEENERGKLESCVSGLSGVIATLKVINDNGLQQLRSSVVKPRVNPWVDTFSTINHQFTEDELSAYEAGVSFMQTLIYNLDMLLSSFKEMLTPTNFDSLVQIVTRDVTARLETVIFKSTFNRLGGLVIDKEIRQLSTFLATSISWSVRDKFARLTQIATILNLEKVSEILDYWGSHEGAITWRLTPTELRMALGLRSDFKIEDIRRLKF